MSASPAVPAAVLCKRECGAGQNQKRAKKHRKSKPLEHFSAPDILTRPIPYTFYSAPIMNNK
jgi:hypothetical protein